MRHIMPNQNKRYEGKVIKWNEEKSCGYIKSKEANIKELFFHERDIIRGWIQKGDKVEFTPKGHRATYIEKTKEATILDKTITKTKLTKYIIITIIILIILTTIKKLI